LQVVVIVGYFVFLQLELLLSVYLDLHLLGVIEILGLLLLIYCIWESGHGLTLIVAHELRIRYGPMTASKWRQLLSSHVLLHAS
jgi:hypothetical protein